MVFPDLPLKWGVYPFLVLLAACSGEEPEVTMEQHINVDANTLRYSCTLRGEYESMPDWIEACNRLAHALMEKLPERGFAIKQAPEHPFNFADTDAFLETMDFTRDTPFNTLEVTSGYISLTVIPEN